MILWLLKVFLSFRGTHGNIVFIGEVIWLGLALKLPTPRTLHIPQQVGRSRWGPRRKVVMVEAGHCWVRGSSSWAATLSTLCFVEISVVKISNSNSPYREEVVISTSKIESLLLTVGFSGSSYLLWSSKLGKSWSAGLGFVKCHRLPHCTRCRCVNRMDCPSCLSSSMD